MAGASGDQRAGFYGYDWFDNGGIPSADRIIPALQHLKVGDDIGIGLGTFKVVAVEPNQSLRFTERLKELIESGNGLTENEAKEPVITR